jgi:hypothetical protein
MLLSADATTPHRNAVLAYDAANDIGLGIAIARPAQGGDKAEVGKSEIRNPKSETNLKF